MAEAGTTILDARLAIGSAMINQGRASTYLAASNERDVLVSAKK
jgi:hypothetical protein